MNIRCPHCQTLFRVDPTRVPSRGIRARCARCGGTFQIAGTAAGDAATPASQSGSAPSGGAPGGAWQGAPHGQPRDEAAHAPASGVPQPGGAGYQPRTTREASSAAPGAPPSGSAGAAMGAQPGATGGQPAGAPQRPVFGSRDPSARAQRIARALVSDIVAYHPERRDQALEAGTLRSEFRDEIMKSWDEYVAQVGQDTAKSTPFFRQALNDILARGQAVF